MTAPVHRLTRTYFQGTAQVHDPARTNTSIGLPLRTANHAPYLHFFNSRLFQPLLAPLIFFLFHLALHTKSRAISRVATNSSSFLPLNYFLPLTSRWCSHFRLIVLKSTPKADFHPKHSCFLSSVEFVNSRFACGSS